MAENLRHAFRASILLGAFIGCASNDPGGGGGGSDTNFLVCNDAGVCHWVTCPGPECPSSWVQGAPLTASSAPSDADAEPDASVPGKTTEATQGTVTGETGSCDYSIETDGCALRCSRDIGTVEGVCDGPAGGAQSCTCELNGVGLCDDAVAAPDGCYPWYADDCVAAAQTMADGFCQHMVDCCFTWTGGDGTPRCSCTADPAVAGFDSCEAAAQAGGGEVVALCPRYVTNSGGFPNAGGTSSGQ